MFFGDDCCCECLECTHPAFPNIDVCVTGQLICPQKKVDPNLQVEVKPSIRARKVQEDKLRRQAQKEEFWRRREQEDRWREEMRSGMFTVHRMCDFLGLPGFLQ